jgi:prophage antirepressor-like protein
MPDESKLFRTFFYQGNQIRTVEHNGETWWVASDVCKVLEIANSRQAINGNEKAGDSGLDEDEKGVLNLYTPGGPQATLCVNEPGLYHLISKSRTPEAKTFGRWVRHEVLPSIRKTGSYSLPQQKPAEPQQQSSQRSGLRTYLLSLSKDEMDGELHYLRSLLAGVEAAYNDKGPYLALSKDALLCEILYLRALVATVETVYHYKYPKAHNFEYPQAEQKPHPIETPVLSPVETKPDLQNVLLDYIRKTGSVTVRYLQQSGPRSLRNLPADQLRTMLLSLVTSGLLTIVQVGKAEHYRLP